MFRASARAQLENTEEFEQIIHLTTIRSWMVAVLFGSLLALLVFLLIWVFVVSPMIQPS